MAPTLPDLPAELLLEIVGNLTPSERRKTMEQLRATHPQIDEKIVRAYASEYHRSVALHLNRTSLTSFESIAKGYLGANIQSLSIDLSGLIRAIVHRPDSNSDSTDIEVMALKTVQEPQTIGDSRATRKTCLDENFFRFLVDGSCAALLIRMLPNLQSMSSLIIRRVPRSSNFDMNQWKDLINRWRLVLRIMFSAVFNHCRPLQLLNIERNDDYPSSTIPILDVASFSPECLPSIKDLAFDLDVSSIYGKSYPNVLALGQLGRRRLIRHASASAGPSLPEYNILDKPEYWIW